MNFKKKTCLISVVLLTAIIPYSCRKDFGSLTQAAGEVSSDASIGELTVTQVSSPATGLNVVGHLVDGSLATAWTGDNANNVYLPNPTSQYVVFRLDTSSMKLVSFIKMAFNTESSTTLQYNFDVLVSQDGQTGWVTVLNNQNSAPNKNLQTFDFPDTRGRFVKIVGHGNNGGNPKTNSWTEVQIFGSVAPAFNSIKFPISKQLVGANNYVSPYVPLNAVDGRLDTYWTSQMSTGTDYKNISINLGAPRLLDEVRLSFYTGTDPNRVSRFGVFVSMDSVKWIKVISNSFSASKQYGNRLESFDFSDVTAKFVRVESYGHTGTYSSSSFNSINEFEVWGSPITNSCRIRSIGQKSTADYATRTGDFYYNNFGKLDSVSFHGVDLDGGRALWTYQYNPAHQLTKLSIFPTEAAFGGGSGTPYFEIFYEYKGNRIIKSITWPISTADATTIYDSLAYDSKGRVSADYSREVGGGAVPEVPVYEVRDTTYYKYDSRDNLIIPGQILNYDNKMSFLRTDSALMFQFKNYSKNNPVSPSSYNAKGFPEGFSNPLPFAFFDVNGLGLIEYTCVD